MKQIIRKSHYLFLLLIMFVLSIGLYLNEKSFIILAFTITIYGLLTSKRESLLDYLLFLIPSANVFKLNYNSFSLYTYISLLSLILLIIVDFKKTKYDKVQFFMITILLFYSGLRLFNYSSNRNEFIGFFINMMLVTLLSNKENKLIDVRKNSVAFALGVLSASVSGLFLQHLPHMRSYFELDNIYLSGAHMSRFVGLIGDPNYYSMEVAVAIVLLLVAYMTKKGSIPKTILLLIITLSIFGFMTLSKTYFIIWGFIIIVWVVRLLPVINLKKMVSISFITGFMIFINDKYKVLNKLLFFYRFRFGNLYGDYDQSLNSLTTGRLQIWRYYFHEIVSSPLIFVFGTGFNRSIRPFSTHNTFISIFYAFGFIGTILLLGYMITLYRSQSSIPKNNSEKKQIALLRFLPLVIFLIYNASLDILFDDYFFLLLLMVFHAINVSFPKEVSNMERRE